MAQPRDLYAALGVPRTASPEEIQRAYRKLARELHPDVNKTPEAEERFKDVSEAYAVLSDPERRERYDAMAAGPRASRFEGGFGGVGFEDLFGDLFPGRGAGAYGRAPVRGADQETEVELSVEEAYHGTRRRLTIAGPDGTRTAEVTIPAGVTDGQRVRLAGQGGPGNPPGDLYLVVAIRPDERYRVEGRDIHLSMPVAPWEAVLGTTVPLDTPGGEAKVKVPPGTSSGRRLRLRGRGLPNARGTPGDLFAEVRIVVPATPSEEERRLYERLADVSSHEPRGRR